MGSDTEHRKAEPEPNKFSNFAGIFFDFVNWQKSVKSSCAQPLSKIDKVIQKTNNLLSKYLAERKVCFFHLKIKMKSQLCCLALPRSYQESYNYC